MLTIYNDCKSVPAEAKKTITAGRLKGYTDINPMWRIKKLTEMFGACGIGWYYERLKSWNEPLANGEVCAFVEIALYIKKDGEWSKPIFGTGGSKLVSLEKKGAYVNDEAYKMATTDAISVACKQLGMGADVYWSADNTKYNDKKKTSEIEDMMADAEATPISKNHVDILIAKASRYGVNVAEKYGKDSIEELTEAEYGRAMNKLAEMGEKNG